MRNIVCILRLALPAAFLLFSLPPAASATTPTTTTLSITVSGSPVTSVTLGTVIALIATVRAGSTPIVPGVVNFCDAVATYCTDVHILGTGQLTSAGTVTVYLVPRPGSQQYKAVFVGTNAASPSSSATMDLAVTGSLPSRMSLTATGTPTAGYKLVATVSGMGLTAPTGIAAIVTNPETQRYSHTLFPSSAVSLETVDSYTDPSADLFCAFPVSADFNNDGISDLAATTGNAVSILLGDGHGAVTKKDWHPIDLPRYMTVGDFNGDGNADLAITNSTDNAVAILLGNGDGTFVAGANPAVGGDPYTIATADFNGDGNADLAVENFGDDTVTILLGHGDGTFTPAAQTLPAGLSPVRVIAADFNGDGKPDLALLQNGSFFIELGNGDGTFTALGNPVQLAATGVTLSAADLNGDGKTDLAILETGSVALFLGNGDGTFGSISPFNWGDRNSGDSLVIADINGDRKPDLAVLDSGSRVTTAFGKGEGTFPKMTTSLPIYPAGTDELPLPQITAGDFNGDGNPDIAGMNWTDGGVTTLIAAADSSRVTVTDVSLPVGSGSYVLTASYLGDLQYATASSNSITLSSADGPNIGFAPDSLYFEPTSVGSTAGYQQIKLSSTGNRVLDISLIGISDTTDFYSWGIRNQTCGSALAAGSSCTFSIAFRPTRTGVITANLRIRANAGSTPLLIPLYGSGR